MPARRWTSLPGSQQAPPEYAEVPPSLSVFSTTQTESPASAASAAAVSAPPPEPTTTTSYSPTLPVTARWSQLERVLGNPRGGPSQTGQRLAHRVEAERAQVERGPVELLEVERGALPRLDLVTCLEPDPLTHLVGRGLRRPAEVAVDLEDDVGVVHPRVLAHELQPE